MLSLADHERLAAFEAFTTTHPHLLKADAQIRAFVDAPAGSAILLVFGPSGAGKTTLLRRVIQTLTEVYAEILNADLERLPPVAFECPSPLGAVFNWTEWFARGLEALQEVAPRDKANVPSDPRLPTEPARSGNLRDLERAFISAARHRRPPAIGVDEAQQLAAVGRGQRLLAQLDFIKSLADAAGSPFLLVGTYDLLALRNLSGQLGRRTQEVHFPRYRINDADDWTAFRSVINTLAKQLPIDGEMLLGEAEHLYARSAGCVGTLKQWLTRAFVAALDDKTDITWAHLERTGLPLATVRQMADEIGVGEDAFFETARDVEELRDLLGMSTKKRKGTTAGTKARGPRRIRSRVGRRAPGHDPVGDAAT
jgi:energy-coupling factor transporter ATP-binding protein EcfA2